MHFIETNDIKKPFEGEAAGYLAFLWFGSIDEPWA